MSLLPVHAHGGNNQDFQSMVVLVLLFCLFLRTANANANDKSVVLHPVVPSSVCERKGGFEMCELLESKSGVPHANFKHQTCNLPISVIRPQYCLDAMAALLGEISALLEFRSIPHWITQGTLLGAMRSGSLIPWSNDVDLHVRDEDFDTVAKVLLEMNTHDQIQLADFATGNWNGFISTLHTALPTEKYPTGSKWIAVSSGIIGIHLDIGAMLAHNDGVIISGQCNFELQQRKDGTNGCRTSTEHHVRIDEIFPLIDIELEGMKMWSPAQPDRVLEKMYGKNWATPDQFGEGDWSDENDLHSVHRTTGTAAADTTSTAAQSTNKGSWTKRPRVYVDIVGDMFHFGHVRLFERARQMGRTLIVGVHDDATVASYKRRPVLTMEERIKIVRSCRFVDEVVPHAPLVLTNEYMDKHGIDMVVRGDDQLYETSRKSYGVAMDRNAFSTVPYTEEISTSEIIQRILNRADKLRSKKEINRFTERTSVDGTMVHDKT